MKPYLVLLRVEFTLQLLLPAIRCALTAPFQPYLFRKRSSAVFSLLHLSSAYAAQALPGTLLIGARTFLPFIRIPSVYTLDTTIKQRLSGQLEAHSTCCVYSGQVEAKLSVTLLNRHLILNDCAHLYW